MKSEIEGALRRVETNYWPDEDERIVAEELKRLVKVEVELKDWKGMYLICNAREQRLLRIKELAQKFVAEYNRGHCWIENGGEEVSVTLDDLTAALRKEAEG